MLCTLFTTATQRPLSVDVLRQLARPRQCKLTLLRALTVCRIFSTDACEAAAVTYSMPPCNWTTWTTQCLGPRHTYSRWISSRIDVLES